MSQPVELRIIPSEGVTDAYAAASGDDNPIHVDEAFARSVGLDGRILHGLWTMAQVGRAAESAAEGPVAIPGGGYKLHSLKVAFRGMGRIGPELVVSGKIQPSGEATLSAEQDGTKLIRNATAELRLWEAP